MTKKMDRIIKEFKTKVNLKISNKVKEINPVINHIADNLAGLHFIHFIRITPEVLQASNEITEGRIKFPVTEPGHSTAIGIYLIIDIAYKNIQFFEITSANEGCGGKMVDAVLKALPQDWKGVVVMDWSHGFWDKMKETHKNLFIF